MSTQKTVLAWHVLLDSGIAQWTGRVPPSTPEHVDGQIVMCKRGLHACRSLVLALYYGEGTLLRRVRLSSEIIEDYDKLCATDRRELWRMQARSAVRRFVVWCAKQLGEPIKKNVEISSAPWAWVLNMYCRLLSSAIFRGRFGTLAGAERYLNRQLEGFVFAERRKRLRARARRKEKRG